MQLAYVYNTARTYSVSQLVSFTFGNYFFEKQLKREREGFVDSHPGYSS